MKIYHAQCESHLRKAWNVLDLMSDNFREPRIFWYPKKLPNRGVRFPGSSDGVIMNVNIEISKYARYPRKYLFSDTIGSFLLLSIAEVTWFLWKRRVPGDPNLWGYQWANFHYFWSKFKLTLFFIEIYFRNLWNSITGYSDLFNSIHGRAQWRRWWSSFEMQQPKHLVNSWLLN